MEISKMAQNTRDGNVGSAPQDAGLQLQIPGLEQFNNLKFVQSEANPADLVIQFPDGSETVIPNYIPLAQAGAPPALTLEDGTVIPGTEIVGLIENLDYDKIATAAGDAGTGAGGTGGGAAFTADPSGLLGDDIGHGPYAGGIALSDQVGFEQLPAGIDPGDGSGDLPFEAIDDHVIHNIQGDGESRNLDNPIDIPDVALRHNDIYPRGSWDLEASRDYGPLNPPGDFDPGQPTPQDQHPQHSLTGDYPIQSQFESASGSNSDPDGNDLGDTTFSGTNTTARFTATSPVVVVDNVGDNYSLMNNTTVADESGSANVQRLDWDHAEFTLETRAPGNGPGELQNDWDGMRIYLYEGEIITITHDGQAPGQYHIALDTDGDNTNGSNPVNTGFFNQLGWEYVSLNSGPITYTVPDGESGYVYVGTGFGGNLHPNSSPAGDYFTQIEIDGVPYGYFDYDATDEVLRDDAHVTVEARDPDNYAPSGEILYGTSGDNIIISSENGDDLRGFAGMDVLIGRGGDDDLRGGVGSDLFLFENAATDGHDTIYDFNSAEGPFNSGEGDIINLDALFDELGIVGARDGLVVANASGSNTELSITGVAPATFSITLDGIGVGDVNIAQLINDGNIVVDES